MMGNVDFAVSASILLVSFGDFEHFWVVADLIDEVEDVFVGPVGLYAGAEMQLHCFVAHNVGGSFAANEVH